MKKILLASTILVGTAGFAAAEVSFSGSAFMGVEKNPALANWAAKSSVSVDVAMSGETDGGLMFGADFTGIGTGALANSASSTITTFSGIWSGYSVWISGDFGKVSLETTFTGATMSLTYSHTIDAFSIDVGYNITTPAWDVELGYDFGDYSVYIGHNTGSGDTRLGGESTFGDFTAGVDLVNDSSVPELDWDISVGWSSGAISIDAALGADASAIGAGDYSFDLDFAYDLGGGASVIAEYSDPDSGAANDETITLGVSMDL